MIVNNDQLSDRQLEDLDSLIAAARQVDGGSPAIYKHLLVLKRDVPCNFLYYTQEKPNNPGQLIGFLGLYFYYAKAAEVSLVVHPQYRHQDIAKKLLQTAYNLCQIKKTQQLIFSTPHKVFPPLLKLMGAELAYREHHLKREDGPFLPIISPKLAVRAARQQDIAVLCNIDKECFQTTDLEEMKERFNIILAEETYHVLVAELANKIIGKVHLRFDEDEVFLSDLAILKAYQHQGLGKELILHAINYVNSHHKDVISLEVETKNAKLLDLYFACGFKSFDIIDFYKVNKFSDEYL
ncbi:MAG: hypothetical protein A3F18_00650 [Legionellales bacterium RIFCSPHIGHO2_12_FULL_37_14]|nr:MAG: hypothetical protein A3F18_00650 [Legionellales bacterium RIFCSPHIGHO2_12_FULL_37_14]